MNISVVKEGTDPDVLKVGLSDGSFFYVRMSYIPYNASLLSPEKTLSEEEVELLQFSSLCYRAERLALKLIARAEQSSGGLAVKLKKRGFSDVVVSTVLERLQRLNFINDYRFAEHWLHEQIHINPSGPRYLIGKLQKRGIPIQIAHTVVFQIIVADTEEQLLQKYVEKKIKSCDSMNDSKLISLLHKAGFSTQSINNYRKE